MGELVDHEADRGCGSLASGRLATGFVPSVHGFPFPNRWKDALLGVFASPGRCGGMAFAALDHYLAGESPAPGGDDEGTPAHGSPLANYILRRQIASITVGLGVNLWRFVRLTYLPTHAPGGAAATARGSLGEIVDSITRGRPVPLGLVSGLGGAGLFRNHQVLAVSIECGEDGASIGVYDPNHPLRDDVVIEVGYDAHAPVLQRAGSRTIEWRGLFVERYSPVRVVPEQEGPLLERAASTRGYWMTAAALLGVWLLAKAAFGPRCRRGRR